MKQQVVCNKKDECGYPGPCSARNPHAEIDMCMGPCKYEPDLNATCQPVPTDLTSPLRLLKGPELYRCTKAAVCKIEDCCAATDHTHDEPVHGPRECGFLLQNVECQKVGEQEPLKGVYFSGKVVETLSMLRGMDPAEWDKLWGMVTDKTERLHEKALEIMADANGPEESVTAEVWEESVRAILGEEIAQAGDGKGPMPKWGSGNYVEVIREATARIAKLPPVRQKP